jgi:hypothetical protein
VQPELDEALLRAREQLVVATGGTESSERKGFGIGPGFQEPGYLTFDSFVVAKRDEGVESGTEDRGPPHVAPLHRETHQLRDGARIAALERGPEAWRAQLTFMAFAGESLRVALELPPPRLVAGDDVRER